MKVAALAAALASLLLVAGSSNPYQAAVPSVVDDDVASAYWRLRHEGFAVAIGQSSSSMPM